MEITKETLEEINAGLRGEIRGLYIPDQVREWLIDLTAEVRYLHNLIDSTPECHSVYPKGHYDLGGVCSCGAKL